MYALATQLNSTNNRSLWLAILGLTDQFIHDRIDLARYNADYKHFKAEVLNFNMTTEEQLLATPQQRDGNPLQQGQIEPSEELRFFMYRHWNLFDSMYHSRFVAVKLGIWTAQGQHQLEVLLAKMGIPKAECQQPFAAMQRQYKDELATLLDAYGRQFNLTNLHYKSFITRRGALVVSAADVVTAITALLESAAPDLEAVKRSADGTVGDLGDQLRRARQRHFWMAYDALSTASNSAEGLHSSLRFKNTLILLIFLRVQR